MRDNVRNKPEGQWQEKRHHCYRNVQSFIYQNSVRFLILNNTVKLFEHNHILFWVLQYFLKIVFDDSTIR